jgi:hypothetical protein
MMGTFGGETMVVGEALEKVPTLVGLRVKVVGENKMGTVYLVYVNRENRLAQVWTNMDSGGARCFRPHHLERVGGSIEQRKMLGMFA